MQKYMPATAANSIDGVEIMNKFIAQNQPNLSIKNLKPVLESKYPNGLCFHYYQNFMGTLWYLIYDLNKLKTNICFSSPNVNKSYEFYLNNTYKNMTYHAEMPVEKPDDSFFNLISINDK